MFVLLVGKFLLIKLFLSLNFYTIISITFVNNALYLSFKFSSLVERIFVWFWWSVATEWLNRSCYVDFIHNVLFFWQWHSYPASFLFLWHGAIFLSCIYLFFHAKLLKKKKTNKQTPLEINFLFKAKSICSKTFFIFVIFAHAHP